MSTLARVQLAKRQTQAVEAYAANVERLVAAMVPDKHRTEGLVVARLGVLVADEKGASTWDATVPHVLAELASWRSFRGERDAW